MLRFMKSLLLLSKKNTLRVIGTRKTKQFTHREDTVKMSISCTALELVVYLLPCKDKLRWHRVNRYWRNFIEDDASWPECQRNALRCALSDTCCDLVHDSVTHVPMYTSELSVLWKYEKEKLSDPTRIGNSRHSMRISFLKESPAWYLALRFRFEEYLASKTRRQVVRDADMLLLGLTTYKGISWRYGGLQLYMDDLCDTFDVITRDIITQIKNANRVHQKDSRSYKKIVVRVESKMYVIRSARDADE